MIDTARRYGVERELGIAWKESGVPRPFLFLCSKLWPTDFGPGTKRAFELSCAKLQTDYLDLYMTHFPVVPDYLGNTRAIREDTWRQLELLYDEGRIRAIGVSNYSEDDLSELLEYCSVAPHVNQCEFHPWYNPVELRSFCEENGILYTVRPTVIPGLCQCFELSTRLLSTCYLHGMVQGYCPIAKGKFLDADVLQKLSSKYGKTPAQICLRWSLEHGVPVIPKSKEKHRIAENRDVFDFSLNDEDMRDLEVLQRCPKKLVRFDDLPDKFDLPDGYKLKGRVYGVPCGGFSLENNPALFTNGFSTRQNVC
ncbi:oxidoreductase, aldo/keto reductase family protein [Ancylostoma caninum]|uniref:Oxidoreductase, aldo/keto reductase family protein n=1 Tax=Ancylostoma caninum TaxID=29170 RepID=A0A368G129_ANCCA|nr:oxidoreductase, aldo/keto reductase family protein [Ancylostoma caninum]